MTPRNLFIIILKIFGLFFLREIIYIIPELISSIPFLVTSDEFGEIINTKEGFWTFILPVFIIAFYSFIIYLLLFKTNIIVARLKLDKGFNQDEFSFNISTSTVLTISLIVIGGIILTNEIPNFCKNVFSYFQEKRLTHGMSKPNYSYIIISAVKIILGFLLIGERKRIVELVQKRQFRKHEDSAL